MDIITFWTKTKLYTFKKNDWIIGGEIYNLPISNPTISLRRYVEGQTLKPNEKITQLTLTALDSGRETGRICLEYKEDYLYRAKESSRSYATLCVQGIELNIEQQKKYQMSLIKLLKKTQRNVEFVLTKLS